MTAAWTTPLTPADRRVLRLSMARAYHIFRVAAGVRKLQGRAAESASLAMAAADCAGLRRDVGTEADQ